MTDREAFDFKSDPTLPSSFAADYLREYYPLERPVTDDEIANYRFIRRIRHLLVGLKLGIDVGCGPTVHHAMMLAPYLETLDLSDYLEVNLDYVRAWVKKLPHCWDWKRYARYFNTEDGLGSGDGEVETREETTRRKIGNILHVNLLEHRPLGDHQREYDLVASFYCTEEVALTTARWRRVIEDLSTLVKPGGFLLLSCLEDTDFYHLKTPDGSPKSLPCARITKGELHNALFDLGFDMNETIIDSTGTPDQAEEGVSGIVHCLAKKADKLLDD